MAKPAQAGLIGKLFTLVLFLVVVVAAVAVVSLFVEIPFVTDFVTNFLKQTPNMIAE